MKKMKILLAGSLLRSKCNFACVPYGMIKICQLAIGKINIQMTSKGKFSQHTVCCPVSGQNSDKATSVSSVVANIASSVQKVSYSKPLHNKTRCLNIMKSFLAFKVISTWIFEYFQKGFIMKLWQNTQFTTAILFCFYSPPSAVNITSQSEIANQSDCLNYQDHSMCIY